MHTNTGMHIDPLASMRLWQLISPALPVGAYAYSAGLEMAIQREWVRNEEQVLDWISGVLKNSLARLDVPVLANLYECWGCADMVGINCWNDFLQASRESSELLAEDRHLGQALARLLSSLEVRQADAWKVRGDTSYANQFALAAVHWKIPLCAAAFGYCFSWCENQVAAAIKLVPLGQTSGQRILTALMPSIQEAVETGLGLDEEDIGLSVPALAMASALHETQYSRLFRS